MDELRDYDTESANFRSSPKFRSTESPSASIEHRMYAIRTTG